MGAVILEYQLEENHLLKLHLRKKIAYKEFLWDSIVISFIYVLGNIISDNISNSWKGILFSYHQYILEYIDYNQIILKCLVFLDILLNKCYNVGQNAY